MTAGGCAPAGKEGATTAEVWSECAMGVRPPSKPVAVIAPPPTAGSCLPVGKRNAPSGVEKVVLPFMPKQHTVQALGETSGAARTR